MTAMFGVVGTAFNLELSRFGIVGLGISRDLGAKNGRIELLLLVTARS